MGHHLGQMLVTIIALLLLQLYKVQFCLIRVLWKHKVHVSLRRLNLVPWLQLLLIRNHSMQRFNMYPPLPPDPQVTLSLWLRSWSFVLLPEKHFTPAH